MSALKKRGLLSALLDLNASAFRTMRSDLTPFAPIWTSDIVGGLQNHWLSYWEYARASQCSAQTGRPDDHWPILGNSPAFRAARLIVCARNAQAISSGNSSWAPGAANSTAAPGSDFQRVKPGSIPEPCGDRPPSIRSSGASSNSATLARRAIVSTSCSHRANQRRFSSSRSHPYRFAPARSSDDSASLLGRTGSNSLR